MTPHDNISKIELCAWITSHVGETVEYIDDDSLPLGIRSGAALYKLLLSISPKSVKHRIRTDPSIDEYIPNSLKQQYIDSFLQVSHRLGVNANFFFAWRDLYNSTRPNDVWSCITQLYNLFPSAGVMAPFVEKTDNNITNLPNTLENGSNSQDLLIEPKVFADISTTVVIPDKENNTITTPVTTKNAVDEMDISNSVLLSLKTTNDVSSTQPNTFITSPQSAKNSPVPRRRRSMRLQSASQSRTLDIVEKSADISALEDKGNDTMTILPILSASSNTMIACDEMTTEEVKSSIKRTLPIDAESIGGTLTSFTKTSKKRRPTIGQRRSMRLVSLQSGQEEKKLQESATESNNTENLEKGPVEKDFVDVKILENTNVDKTISKTVLSSDARGDTIGEEKHKSVSLSSISSSSIPNFPISTPSVSTSSTRTSSISFPLVDSLPSTWTSASLLSNPDILKQILSTTKKDGGVGIAKITSEKNQTKKNESQQEGQEKQKEKEENKQMEVGGDTSLIPIVTATSEKTTVTGMENNNIVHINPACIIHSTTATTVLNGMVFTPTTQKCESDLKVNDEIGKSMIEKLIVSNSFTSPCHSPVKLLSGSTSTSAFDSTSAPNPCNTIITPIILSPLSKRHILEKEKESSASLPTLTSQAEASLLLTNISTFTNPIITTVDTKSKAQTTVKKDNIDSSIPSFSTATTTELKVEQKQVLTTPSSSSSFFTSSTGISSSLPPPPKPGFSTRILVDNLFSPIKMQHEENINNINILPRTERIPTPSNSTISNDPLSPASTFSIHSITQPSTVDNSTPHFSLSTTPAKSLHETVKDRKTTSTSLPSNLLSPPSVRRLFGTSMTKNISFTPTAHTHIEPTIIHTPSSVRSQRYSSSTPSTSSTVLSTAPSPISTPSGRQYRLELTPKGTRVFVPLTPSSTLRRRRALEKKQTSDQTMGVEQRDSQGSVVGVKGPHHHVILPQSLATISSLSSRRNRLFMDSSLDTDSESDSGEAKSELTNTVVSVSSTHPLSTCISVQNTAPPSGTPKQRKTFAEAYGLELRAVSQFIRSSVNATSLTSEKPSSCPSIRDKLQQFQLFLGNTSVALQTAMNQRVAALEKALIIERSRRKVYMARLLDAQGTIRVFARVRPLSFSEREASIKTSKSDAETLLSIHDETTIRIFDSMNANTSINSNINSGGMKANRNGIISQNSAVREFEFEKVFTDSHSQEDVFEEILPLVDSATEGFNVCIFAYGQTGSGKTYTMEGDTSAQGKGIISRSLEHIFDCGILKPTISKNHVQDNRQDDEKNTLLPETDAKCHLEVSLSSVEVYNEKILDLLVSPTQYAEAAQGAGLEPRLLPTGVVTLPGLTALPITSVSEALNALTTFAQKNRQASATLMNTQSSRSHMLVFVNVEKNSTTIVQGVASTTKTKGCLVLVDLAGSERVDRSGVVGTALKEAASINQSLSVLGAVISGLRNKDRHVSFRDSKLTFLLQGYLAGASAKVAAKVAMICNLSPAKNSHAETLSSLRFASRVRSTSVGKAKKQVVASAFVVAPVVGEVVVGSEEANHGHSRGSKEPIVGEKHTEGQVQSIDDTRNKDGTTCLSSLAQENVVLKAQLAELQKQLASMTNIASGNNEMMQKVSSIRGKLSMITKKGLKKSLKIPSGDGLRQSDKASIPGTMKTRIKLSTPTISSRAVVTKNIIRNVTKQSKTFAFGSNIPPTILPKKHNLGLFTGKYIAPSSATNASVNSIKSETSHGITTSNTTLVSRPPSRQTSIREGSHLSPSSTNGFGKQVYPEIHSTTSSGYHVETSVNTNSNVLSTPSSRRTNSLGGEKNDRKEAKKKDVTAINTAAPASKRGKTVHFGETRSKTFIHDEALDSALEGVQSPLVPPPITMLSGPSRGIITATTSNLAVNYDALRAFDIEEENGNTRGLFTSAARPSSMSVLTKSFASGAGFAFPSLTTKLKSAGAMNREKMLTNISSTRGTQSHQMLPFQSGVQNNMQFQKREKHASEKETESATRDSAENSTIHPSRQTTTPHVQSTDSVDAFLSALNFDHSK